LKFVGPGHRLDKVVPEPHCEVQRQLPPVPHTGLEQHLMSSGVPGQALGINRPPPEVHLAVAMQTPGAPPSPVQGPSTAAKTTWSPA
jgi:hypothetical protein